MIELGANPRVSIILTNFNKSSFFLKALNSCLIQNYKNIEIIFFDDKSTDNSIKKIKKFKRDNKLNLKIILNKKKKFFSSPINQFLAIKKSLKFANGKLICLLDADDFFHEKKVYEIVKIFEKKNTKIVIDQPIYLYKKQMIKKKYSNYIFKNKWPKFPPTSCMTFEKKTLNKVISKIDCKKFPNLAIDFYLAVYYSIVLNNFYIHNSHLTYYRQVNDGTESNYVKFKNKKWWIRRNEAFNFLNTLLIKCKMPPNKGFDYTLTKIINLFL
jgi:glycosyltransferase involved in cell wall biosynthesis